MLAKVDGRRLRHQHRRPELLAAATEHVLQNGLSGFSLRNVAAAVGVSHASLLRHFSTKDDLLWQILETVRRDFLAEGLDVAADGPQLPADQLRSLWHRLCEERQQRQFGLLFELVGQSLREQGRLAEFARTLVDDWRAVTKAELERMGCPAVDADDLATLVLAQVRGLQLDLMITQDAERVHAAVDSALSAIDFSGWSSLG